MEHTKETLIAFEEEVIKYFEEGKIKGPVHLSKCNENQLLEVFSYIKDIDYIFSTWRNHYHALLHNIPKEKVMEQILQGKSINLCFPEYNFFTSAIVGGIIPIATGLAYALKKNNSDKKVYCFIGDMAYSIGMFKDSYEYAKNFKLPIIFVVEDNGLSTNSITKETWGIIDESKDKESNLIKIDNNLWYYKYKREYPHVGIGKFLHF